MVKSGSSLIRYALEQLPISYVFGVPGMQNIEMYDAVASSKKIKPILVSHEQGASFAADGIARVSNEIAVAFVVPGAGISNAFSGICEALVDGVAMLIITASVREDTGKSYQLHEIDQQKMVAGAVKKSYHVTKLEDIVPTIFEAYNIATTGCPGPVFIDIPAELPISLKNVNLPKFEKLQPAYDLGNIKKAVNIIKKSKKVGIFAGYGCKNASDKLKELSNFLQAPVFLTLQGYGILEYDFPFHCGLSFGSSAVPAAKNAYKNCDCLIAIGCRFSEIATGSYSVTVPENLIHIDIDKNVFNKNYKAKVTIESDANIAITELLNQLIESKIEIPEDRALIQKIAKDKVKYYDSYVNKNLKNINPAKFLKVLSENSDEYSYTLTDVGNHTFLTAEFFKLKKAGHLIGPSDFNCMGYSIPAAIGVKLINPTSMVNVIVGDGCFRMTGMELLSAVENRLGIVYYVFEDGDLAQIAIPQKTSYNRKTCTVLPKMDLEFFALAVGAQFIAITDNSQIEEKVKLATKKAEENMPVIVQVSVNYKKKTAYTKGIIKTNIKRFTFTQKLKFISRMAFRRIKN